MAGLLGRWRKRAAVAAVAAATALAASGGGAVAQERAQEGVRWQVPIAYGTALAGLGDTMIWVADALRAVSGGAIDLHVAEPGVAAPATGVFAAVASGAVPAGYSWMGFEAEIVPAAPLFGGAPFGLGSEDFLAWMEFHGGRALLDRAFAPHGVRPIPCGTAPAEAAGWFRAPLTGPQDLEGLAFRALGLGGEVLAELGAEVTAQPGGSLVRALAEGEVAAAEFLLPSVDAQLGLNLAAPILYLPGWQQPATNQFLYVNLGIWEALEPGTQALIELACTAANARSLAAAAALQGDALAGFAAEGIAVEPLPPAVLDALRAATRRVMERHAAADETFARVYAAMTAYQEEIAPWKALDLLPPPEAEDAGPRAE